jgi:serine/threonine-protein kinase
VSRALDVVATSSILVFSAALIPALSPAIRPDLEFSLACSLTLAVRAAFVPSTVTRTAALGGLGLVALMTGTAIAAFGPHGGESPLLPVAAVAVSGIWMTCSLGACVAVSKVSYGLRRSVERAAELGQYTLGEKIGEGGMGAVYRARHAMLRRETAIKLLPPGKAGERALARFEREVQATATLAHPNTITIYDYGRTPDGSFYYAMEYVDGPDLQTLVGTAGPLPPGRAIHLLRQIAEALAEAHALGLVHRDVKPANVLVGERGGRFDFVKVVDFGLVKLEAGDAGASLSAAAGGITGTPHYMSPEAVVDPLRVDARSDLYSLGALAYFLLTGSTVFDGATAMEVCVKQVHAEVPSLRARAKAETPIPDALEALVLACLAKKPEDRPASASALADELASLAAALPWSDGDARAWWQANADAPRKRGDGRDVSPFSRTVAIDLTHRGEELAL